MGIASVRPADVPVLSEKPMIGAEVQADGGTVRMTAVSVGNPHAVLFLPEIRSLDLERSAPDTSAIRSFRTASTPSSPAWYPAI